MANTKKYVSLDKLSLYDEKIKKVITDADAVALQSAKDYADSLAENYDAAGAAATAEENAKAYADGKNAAIQAAQKAADDAAAAASVADGKAVAAQGDVDALETYVGTFTHDTAKTVVEYINAKTDGIATSGNLEALGTRVTTVEGKVATIEGDYLKAADKTELEGKINAKADQTALNAVSEVANAAVKQSDYDTKVKALEDEDARIAGLVTAEETRAKGIEDGLAARIKAVEDDYLVAADKEALQTQINTIMNNPDAEGAINSINEFTQYVKDHGTIADGFRSDIDKNKEDIAANAKAIADHETLAGQTYATKTELANEKKAIQEEIDTDVKVVADDLAELEGVVTGLGNTKADKTALETAIQTLEGADTGLGNRITALEGKLGTGEGSVDSKIATAKQEAIDAAAGDATSKANAAESAAKGHADSLNTAMNARVELLEAIDHDHSNKGVLDGITADKVAGWDDADAKAHEHSNLTVLEGITSAKVTAWDAAEGNAKGYADGLNTAMNTRVESLEAWHENFVECSQEDIQNLFN